MMRPAGTRLRVSLTRKHLSYLRYFKVGPQDAGAGSPHTKRGTLGGTDFSNEASSTSWFGQGSKRFLVSQTCEPGFEFSSDTHSMCDLDKLLKSSFLFLQVRI